jgi:hypothetical protein
MNKDVFEIKRRNCRKTSNPVSDKSFGIFTVYYYICTTYETVEFVF